MLRSIPARVLLALWMVAGLAFVVPAHHHGEGMLRGSACLDSAHHDDTEHGEDRHHDSSHCAICVFAGGLAAPQIVAVLIPPPQVIDHRQAFAPVQVFAQDQPAPISERGPPLA